jgi:phosphohistidine swiveling domain-containing protein
MLDFVTSLEQASEDPEISGGKGASLARLVRAGLPVPPGFVISTEAFRAARNGESWPGDLRAEVEREYLTLNERTGGVPVAVRSSATGEDAAEASFAGQHATILNVRDTAALFDAIAACWASLHNDHAAEYRRSHRIDEDGAAMAVVVQTLVQAEASGVAFTIDPLSGESDVVLIDTVYGLGEGAVGGTITPDHYVVRKASGAVASEIVDKRQRIVASPGGGLAIEDTPDNLREKPVLDESQALELARLAVRCEELAGSPQDVEWAYAAGQFHVLQSRPVTAAGRPDSPEEWFSEFDTPSKPDTVWTAANVQEVLPDQLSPMGCSINLRILEEHGTEAMERTGVRLKDPDPFSAYFYGRAFLNVTLTAQVSDQIPFADMEPIMEQYYEVPPELMPKAESFSPGKLWRYANVVPRMLWFTVRYPSDVRKAETVVETFEREREQAAHRRLSDSELVRKIDDSLTPSAEVGITHVSGAGITGARFDILRTLTKNWLGDDDGSLHARLCTGLASLESARPAYELWEVSRLVLGSEALRDAFASRDGTEIVSRIASLEGDDITRFHEQMDGFLRRHGHRSVMEAEIAAVTWEDDLPSVYAMVRNYVRAGDDADPRRIEARQAREREDATRHALSRLSWWKRPVFQLMLKQAQEGIVSREHTKSMLVRGTQYLRRLTRELAERLVAEGRLDAVPDFYYLRWEEVPAFVGGETTRDEAYALIDRRRTEEDRNRDVVLPEVFRGRPKPIRAEDVPLPEGETLEGLPVSPGRVTGPARVIFDPRKDATIEPGEILVAPVTDAGWTPLFVAAAGVVVDVGGTLSHGSTVAREYGLPAVVNVKHGTRMIRTGQTITVDGTQGVVVLGPGHTPS